MSVTFMDGLRCEKPITGWTVGLLLEEAARTVKFRQQKAGCWWARRDAAP